jgi:hypothetical protein
MNDTQPFAVANRRVDECLEAMQRRLDRMSGWRWIFISAFTTVVLSVCSLAPRLWILRQPTLVSFECDRGRTFIEQSKAP